MFVFGGVGSSWLSTSSYSHKIQVGTTCHCGPVFSGEKNVTNDRRSIDNVELLSFSFLDIVSATFMQFKHFVEDQTTSTRQISKYCSVGVGVL